MQHLASAAPLWRNSPSNYYNLVCSIWPRQPPSGDIPQATTIIWNAASGLGSPPLEAAKRTNLTDLRGVRAAPESEARRGSAGVGGSRAPSERRRASAAPPTCSRRGLSDIVRALCRQTVRWTRERDSATPASAVSFETIQKRTVRRQRLE
ncbi:unnamed protein product, partial [Iphiclides podalirius]